MEELAPSFPGAVVTCRRFLSRESLFESISDVAGLFGDVKPVSMGVPLGVGKGALPKNQSKIVGRHRKEKRDVLDLNLFIITISGRPQDWETIVMG